LNCFGGTTYDVITYNTKNVNIFRAREDIPGAKTPFFFALGSLSDQQQLFFTS